MSSLNRRPLYLEIVLLLHLPVLLSSAGTLRMQLVELTDQVFVRRTFTLCLLYQIRSVRVMFCKQDLLCRRTVARRRNCGWLGTTTALGYSEMTVVLMQFRLATDGGSRIAPSKKRSRNLSIGAAPLSQRSDGMGLGPILISPRTTGVSAAKSADNSII